MCNNSDASRVQRPCCLEDKWACAVRVIFKLFTPVILFTCLEEVFKLYDRPLSRKSHLNVLDGQHFTI